MKDKSMILIAIVLSVFYSHLSLADVTPTNIYIQKNACEPGYRKVTLYEARRMLSSIRQKMGKWQISNLANGYVIKGGGYGMKIQKSPQRVYSWCTPIKNSQPTPPQDLLPLLLEENDEDSLEWKLVNKEEFYKNWAIWSDMLGFAYIGGYRPNIVSPYLVGENMDISRVNAHHYRVVGHSNDDILCPSCNKTKLDFDNFNYIIQPSSLKTSNNTTSGKELVATKHDNAFNLTDETHQYRVIFSYTQSTNWNKTDTYDFSQKVTSKSKVDFPLVGENEMLIEIGEDQSFATTSSGSKSQSITNTAIVTVPPHSKVPVTMNIYTTDVDYDYSFDANVSYDVTIKGIMKRSDNALKDHPRRVEYLVKKFTVGRGSIPETNLEYQYSHPNSVSLGRYWDWNYLNEKYNKSTIDFQVSSVLRPIKTKITGHFHASSTSGSDVYFGPIEPWNKKTSLLYHDMVRQKKN
ncbi:aerolysin family beta-barrel pore-forming toxin [Vibrio sp. Vb339]|uniref:aerolysin family beta-barrel pore-forming toxin n=1 Tax=Vibrio sp. Vb339 TaxID=1192013 RepID=UPI00155342D2|nr:aerolysin family beta-barrel pore-forming toxin [Vibrio sp. Vb339]